jgi:hypothetical protein
MISNSWPGRLERPKFPYNDEVIRPVGQCCRRSAKSGTVGRHGLQLSGRRCRPTGRGPWRPPRWPGLLPGDWRRRRRQGALNGVHGEPVVVGWAARRARAGVGGLAGAAADLSDALRNRALGQLGAGRAEAHDDPVHVGAPGRVWIVDYQGELDRPGRHARPAQRRGEVVTTSQVNRSGMGEPAVNAGLETVIGSSKGTLGSCLAVTGRTRRQPGQAQHQQPPRAA